MIKVRIPTPLRPLTKNQGEIDVAAFLEAVPFLVSKEGAGEPLGLFRGQRRMIGPDGLELSEAPPDPGSPGKSRTH